jgi:hypothetical protein
MCTRYSTGKVCLPMLLTLSAFSQERNNHAVLPGFLTGEEGTHIEFTAGQAIDMGPMPLTFSECSATISDTTGSFLFSTANGIVYDNVGAVMDQGDLFMGGNGDVTQGSLIFPRPGDPDLYDVLYIRDTPITSPIVMASWVTVDMSLNGGSGSVVSNTIFGVNFTEKLAGTPHSNGVDYWAVFHEWGTNAFRSYIIGQDGLDTVPSVSYAGSPHTSAYGECNLNSNFQGEMKLSYAGDRLALCNPNHTCDDPVVAVVPSIVQLFHFNDSTGMVTYWMNLPEHRLSYGLDFSPDGSKLYVSGADNTVHYVDQYDLNAGDTASISASRFRVFSSTYSDLYAVRPSAMAFAPDQGLGSVPVQQSTQAAEDRAFAFAASTGLG